MKTPANQLHEAFGPGPLADFEGVVDQHGSFPGAVPLTVEFESDEYAATVWTEWLDPAPETTVVATHTAGPAPERPETTRTERGDGSETDCGV